MSVKIKRYYTGFNRLNKKIKKDRVFLFYFFIIAGILAFFIVYLPLILLNFACDKINFFFELNMVVLVVVFVILFVFYLWLLSKALDRGWI